MELPVLFPSVFLRVFKNQTSECYVEVYVQNDVCEMYPIVTSNMLLPTELDTAMSPNPFFATITLVIRSGMLVPAAKNVSPITYVRTYACVKYHNDLSLFILCKLFLTVRPTYSL